MATSKLEIEKLDRNMSFNLWQIKMRALLTHNRLNKAYLEKEKLASIMTKEKMEDLDEKIVATIQLYLSNEVLREVNYEKTAVALWAKLEEPYLKKSLLNKLAMKHCLHMLNMVEGTSLRIHIDEFTSIMIDLENFEIKYEEEDLALILLRSLPASYKNFRDTLIYTKETLKVEDVKSTLFSKELMDKELV